MPFIALYIRSSILYATHCLIGSQGNWRSTGVIHVRSELWVLDTRWVAQFWTYCSPSRTDHGNPYRSALQGHLPVLSVPGVGHLQILHCSEAGHLTTPGPFPSFWHAGCKGMFSILYMHFFIAYQARITSRNWSYRCESTFFGYWIKFLLILLFEEHPFIFIKLLITYNFTALYYM